MSAVVIIESGGANIASLQFALERQGCHARASADAAEIRAASHVILPGVGAASDAMTRLRAADLAALIPRLTQPVLGICLGLQLLFDSSAEGPADRVAYAPGRPVPHIGWNTLEARCDSPLLAGLGAAPYAYFVHSYALPVGTSTLASTDYGTPFSACVAWNNFYGVQFHPERSGPAGERLLKRFAEL